MTARRRAWRALLWVMVLGTMGMIFSFSAQPGEQSSDLSTRIAEWILRVFAPTVETFAPARRQLVLEEVCFYVRKAAHFGEYAFLAFWACLLLREYAAACAPLKAWAWATLYAATDEVHQLLVSGRAGMVRDVAIDSAGALVGAGVAMGILLIKKQRIRNK